MDRQDYDAYRLYRLYRYFHMSRLYPSCGIGQQGFAITLPRPLSGRPILCQASPPLPAIRSANWYNLYPRSSPQSRPWLTEISKIPIHTILCSLPVVDSSWQEFECKSVGTATYAANNWWVIYEKNPRCSLLESSDYKGVRKMLVLSRHRDESIIIGDDIVITIVDIRGDKVRLGIQAPTEIPVHRQEVYEAIQRERKGGQQRAESGA